jgi:hypothetical protein
VEGAAERPMVICAALAAGPARNAQSRAGMRGRMGRVIGRG